MPDYLDELARFVAETTIDDLSCDVVDAARDVALDTLGAITAGMQEPENKRLAFWAAANVGPSVASLIATPHRAGRMGAALVNATAGVALEMDEGNRFGGGHPAIHVLPGLLAFAESTGAAGSDFITALVVGYEITSRLGGATTPRPNVHSHGHWGAPGVAAAIAKLKRWPPADVRGVIDLAAGMSPANTWTNAFEGTTARNLYPGRSSMQGVLAVDLYECGFRGVDDAPSDVYGTILGESFDPVQATSGLGGEYRIQQNYFKLHACCRYNHATLDAVIEAMGGARIQADEIESVIVDVPWMLDGMLGAYPENMLAAKFNLPYAVVATLVTGRTDIDVFRLKVIADPFVREVFERVHVRVGTVPRQEAVTNPSSRVEIRLRDGTVLDGATTTIRGDYGNRIPRSELLDKFNYLVEPVLGSKHTRLAVERISGLDRVDDMRHVAEAFRTTQKSTRATR